MIERRREEGREGEGQESFHGLLIKNSAGGEIHYILPKDSKSNLCPVGWNISVCMFASVYTIPLSSGCEEKMQSNVVWNN